jgi:hypothetical protein
VPEQRANADWPEYPYADPVDSKGRRFSPMRWIITEDEYRWATERRLKEAFTEVLMEVWEKVKANLHRMHGESVRLTRVIFFYDGKGTVIPEFEPVEAAGDRKEADRECC